MSAEHSTTRLSTKGQLVLGQDFRDTDHLNPGDDFFVERLAPGKYLFTRITPPDRPEAKLTIQKNGLPLLSAGKSARKITSALVREIEASE